MITSDLLTAEQVARMSGRSKSQVNRDAAGECPKLAAAVQFPGYNGPRLFEADAVRRAYGIPADREATS